MESTNNSINKILRSKFLPVLLLLLIIVNIGLAYFYFFSSEVLIINKSKVYKLEYTSSNDFKKILRDLNLSTNPQTKKKNNIKRIKIIVSDDIANERKDFKTLPINIEIDQKFIKTQEPNIELTIDSTLAKSWTTNELNSLILNLLISRLYVSANPWGNENKILKINNYLNNFKKNKGSPFTFILYEKG